MQILILDDEPYRHEGFRLRLEGHDVSHVWTYQQAIDRLSRGGIDVAYLDHDLGAHPQATRDSGSYGGSYEFTGTDVAHFIVAMDPDARPKRVVVHSWNPDGGRRMAEILTAAGVPCQRIPYQTAP